MSNSFPSTDTQEIIEQTKAYYAGKQDLTMIFTPAEDSPVFSAESKYSVSDDGPRAESRTFSLAIPNGWVNAEDVGGRAFVLVPEELADEGMDSDIAILHGEVPVPDEAASSLQQSAVPPVQWALTYGSRSSNMGGTIEMHEVNARNCRCAVVQMPVFEDDCFEFYLHPYSLTGRDYARVTFYDPGDITYEQARTFVDNLARTVQINGPTTPKIMERLDERLMEAKTAHDAWELAAVPVVSVLSSFRQNVLDAGIAFCRADDPSADGEKTVTAGLCAMSQYLDLCACYAIRLVGLLDDWAGCHAPTDEDKKSLAESLGIMERVFILDPGTFQQMPVDRDTLEEICKPSPKQQVLLDKINEVRAKLDLPASAQADAGQDEPAQEQEAEPAPAQGEGMDLVVFFLTFLSKGWFFFTGNNPPEDDSIAWDGTQHSIANMTIDSSSLQEIQQFIQAADAGFDDAQDVANYLLAFLRELEKDEGLRVPRERIARGIQKALPKGPLTGMTLANLCESSRGLIFKGGYATYQVFFDARLSRGIPQFFSLVARMLWDLRSFVRSLDGRPFDIMFLSTRSFDSDPYIGAVDEPVEGAEESPTVLHVTERPAID